MRIITSSLCIAFAVLLDYIGSKARAAGFGGFSSCWGTPSSCSDGMHSEEAEALPAREFVNFGPKSFISLAIKDETFIEYGEFRETSSHHLSFWPVYRRGDLMVGPDRAYMQIVDSGLPHEPIRPAQHFTAHLPIVRNNEKNHKNPESVCFITHGAHTYYAKLTRNFPPTPDSASRVRVIGEFRKKVYYFIGVIKVWDQNKLPPAWVKREQTPRSLA